MRFDLQLSMHIVIVEQFSSKSSIFSNIYVQNILVTIYFKLLFWQNPYKWTRNPKFYIYYIYTGNIHLIFFINYHDVRYIWGYNLNARTMHIRVTEYCWPLKFYYLTYFDMVLRQYTPCQFCLQSWSFASFLFLSALWHILQTLLRTS